MRQHIPNSQLRVIPKAGHYSAWEQPEEAGKLVRQFLHGVVGNGYNSSVELRKSPFWRMSANRPSESGYVATFRR